MVEATSVEARVASGTDRYTTESSRTLALMIGRSVSSRQFGAVAASPRPLRLRMPKTGDLALRSSPPSALAHTAEVAFVELELSLRATIHLRYAGDDLAQTMIEVGYGVFVYAHQFRRRSGRCPGNNLRTARCVCSSESFERFSRISTILENHVSSDGPKIFSRALERRRIIRAYVHRPTRVPGAMDCRESPRTCAGFRSFGLGRRRR